MWLMLMVLFSLRRYDKMLKLNWGHDEGAYFSKDICSIGMNRKILTNMQNSEH